MQNIKKVAISAAKKAGKILVKAFSSDCDFKMKSKYDLVTEADFQSEKIILDEIKKSFPDHSILSEEAGRETKKSDYLWIVDPLDGTVNFSQYLEEFCISIALAYKGEIIFGLVYQPVLDHMYIAEKGKGAYLNNKKIRVADKTNLIEAMGVTESSKKIKGREKNFKTILEVFEKVRDFRMLGSAALSMAKLAAGKIDFYFNNGFNYWDYAAGVILVKEAGGKVTDLDENEVGEKSKNIMAANCGLYKDLFKMLS